MTSGSFLGERNDVTCVRASSPFPRVERGSVCPRVRAMEATTLEYSESTTVTLEWTLNGLKNLFDSRSICILRVCFHIAEILKAKGMPSRK
jgi:hypothetical protein